MNTEYCQMNCEYCGFSLSLKLPRWTNGIFPLNETRQPAQVASCTMSVYKIITVGPPC